MSNASRRIVIGASLGGAAAVLLRFLVFALYTVPSASMAPSIIAGDWLVVNRLSSKIDRGDIVVFELKGQAYVKRVLGLPGDRIEQSEGHIRINGEPIAAEQLRNVNLDDDGAELASGGTLPSYLLARERLGVHAWTVAWFRGASPRSDSWTVPLGSYMMIGDNRDNSLDSRIPSFGFIAQATIQGRAIGILGNLRHGGRWLASL